MKVKSDTFRSYMACCISVAVLLLAATPGRSEVTVKLRLEHSSFLQYEPVNAYVSIFNDSNVPLVVHSEGNASIKVLIDLKREELTPPLKVVQPAFGNMSLKPGEKREIATDLSAAFDMREMGRYTITVVVDLGSTEWASNAETIDIVRGLDIQSVSRLIPGYEDPKMARTYTLRYWPREGKEYLFLSVDEDNSGVNYGVIQLGRIVRVFKPILDVDKKGTVTVVHQASQDCFFRSIFKSTRTGVRFVNQTYHLENGDPYPTRESRKKEESDMIPFKNQGNTK